MASNTQLAFAWHALARCVGCLLGGVKTRELAALARRVTLAVVGLRTLEGTALQDGLSLLAWGDVRAVTSNTQPAFAWHARKPHCAGCVSGGSELREVATRSRLAALFVVVLRTLFWHCTNEKPLSFGARPWFDVRAVTSNTQPASRDRRIRATTLAVSRKVAKHASLLCALVVLRWLWSFHALRNGTAPAEGLSLSVQDHGATCELWPPTRSRHLRGTRASPTALAVSREVANFASLPRARAPYSAGDGRTTHNIMALHQRKASLIRCETVVRRASCGFQHAAGFRVARACVILRWLSLGRWQNTQACRARARRAMLVLFGLRTLESTAPAENLSLSAHDRGATCELWLPTRSWLLRGTRLRDALAVFWEG